VERLVLEGGVVSVGLNKGDVGVLFCIFFCFCEKFSGDVDGDEALEFVGYVGKEEACSAARIEHYAIPLQNYVA